MPRTFAKDIRPALVAARRRKDLPPEVATAIGETLKFLNRRLTEAAKHGCHHCGEGERGSPCWWCGLRN